MGDTAYVPLAVFAFFFLSGWSIGLYYSISGYCKARWSYKNDTVRYVGLVKATRNLYWWIFLPITLPIAILWFCLKGLWIMLLGISRSIGDLQFGKALDKL